MVAALMISRATYEELHDKYGEGTHVILRTDSSKAPIEWKYKEFDAYGYRTEVLAHSKQGRLEELVEQFKKDNKDISVETFAWTVGTEGNIHSFAHSIVKDPPPFSGKPRCQR